MRTKLLLAVGVAAVVVAVVVGIRSGLGVPKVKLAEYFSQQLPASITVEDAKSSQLRKDPELFWLLAHSEHDAAAIVANKFRQSDAADKEFVQKAMKDAFPNKFVAESTDLVWGHDERDFDVFVLTKHHRTNSFVMVLKK